MHETKSILTPYLPRHICRIELKTVTQYTTNENLFLISNLCRVLKVLCFRLGNFPASEFYTVCPTRYRTRHFFNNSAINKDIVGVRSLCEK